MIITSLFSNIHDKITISNKLGIILTNIDNSQRGFYKKLVLEDNFQRKHKDDFLNIEFKYRSMSMSDILKSDYYKVFFKGLYLTGEQCAEAITDNVICIEVEETKGSYLYLKNEHFTEQILEACIVCKLLKLHNFLDTYANKPSENKNVIIYTTSNQGRGIDLLSTMELATFKIPETSYRFKNHNIECVYKVTKLKELGTLIDNYIEDDKDFFVIDFILEVINEDKQYNPFTIIKMLSIVEIIIFNKSSLRSQMKVKLPEFMSNRQGFTDSEKIEWLMSVYTIRSKIAHGEYLELIQESKKFKERYMQKFNFDYYEQNELSWILDNICGDLYIIVANLITTLLKDKSKIEKLKKLNTK